MSRQINQPINQVRLTNVAMVRMNKGGKRFEIACYRNKVVNYRQGLETDLSEVLQTERVFTNVSKGEFAKRSDLMKVFGTDDQDTIIQLILEKGDLQVSDKEREQHYEQIQRDIATWISENCIHPVTQRPYTIPQIRQAMKQSEYVTHPTRSLKRQYLDCVKLIQNKNVLNIARAKMRVKLTYLSTQQTLVQQFVDQHNLHNLSSKQDAGGDDNDEGNQNDDDDNNNNNTASGASSSMTFLVDPSFYRPLDEISKAVEGGRLEILNQVVKREGDTTIDEEIRQQQEQQTLQQQQQRNDGAGQNNHDPDLVIAGQLHNILRIEENEKEEVKSKTLLQNNEEDEQKYQQHTSLRKDQKKAQKKSKKQKRREKEEAIERQVRIDAEQQRQQQRQEAGTGNNNNNRATPEQNITCTGVSHNDVPAPIGQNNNSSSNNRKACNTCGGSFTVAEYRSHFKSDWHRYNQKLKLQGAAPASQDEFKFLMDSSADMFGF